MDADKTILRTSKGGVWFHIAEALKQPRCDLQARNQWSMVIVDVDRVTVSESYPWDIEDTIPRPNWLVRNTVTGRYQAFYCLADPVHKNDDSSKRALLFLENVHKRLRVALGGDTAYHGRGISLNPLAPPADYEPVWLRKEAYTLHELHRRLPSLIEPPWWNPRPRSHVVEDLTSEPGMPTFAERFHQGERNEGMFRVMVKEAHNATWGPRLRSGGDAEWLSYGLNFNRQHCSPPLSDSEATWILESCARYSRRQYTDRSSAVMPVRPRRAPSWVTWKRDPEKQRALAYKRHHGREDYDPTRRNARIRSLAKSGRMSQRKIQTIVGVSQATVRRVLASAEAPRAARTGVVSHALRQLGGAALLSTSSNKTRENRTSQNFLNGTTCGHPSWRAAYRQRPCRLCGRLLCWECYETGRFGLCENCEGRR